MKRASNLFSMEEKEVVRAECIFERRGGMYDFLIFFNSFIRSPMTRDHSDTRPKKREIIHS